MSILLVSEYIERATVVKIARERLCSSSAGSSRDSSAHLARRNALSPYLRSLFFSPTYRKAENQKDPTSLLNWTARDIFILSRSYLYKCMQLSVAQTVLEQRMQNSNNTRPALENSARSHRLTPFSTVCTHTHTHTVKNKFTLTDSWELKTNEEEKNENSNVYRVPDAGGNNNERDKSPMKEIL